MCHAEKMTSQDVELIWIESNVWFIKKWSENRLYNNSMILVDKNKTVLSISHANQFKNEHIPTCFKRLQILFTLLWCTGIH